MKIHYATISETGKRQNNEDAFRIVNSEDGNRWLAVVCDGMGGHAMGEVASETVNPSQKKEAFLFRFNKAKYEELKQEGFRLEF